MGRRSSADSGPSRDEAGSGSHAAAPRVEALESLLDAGSAVAYGRFARDGALLHANPRLRSLIGDVAVGARLPDLVVKGQRERMTRLLGSGERSGTMPNVHFGAGDRVPTTQRLSWLREGDELLVLGESPGDDLEGVETTLFKLNSRLGAQARQDAKTSGRLLEDVLRSNEELEAANREFQEFAYSIAHELRSPLRALDGFSLIVLQDSADRLDETGRRNLERIRAASQRMAELLDAQLALARTGRRNVELGDVDVTLLARRIVDQRLAEDRARRVVCTIAEGLTAHTDAVLAASVLDCLLDNAWKFTSGVAKAHIDVGSEMRDGEQVFFVRDDGAGFDPAFADKLFLPFERLHSTDEYAGMGMGLATARRLLARIGGRCWADGGVGQGAVVWFTLAAKA